PIKAVVYRSGQHGAPVRAVVLSHPGVTFVKESSPNNGSIGFIPDCMRNAKTIVYNGSMMAGLIRHEGDGVDMAKATISEIPTLPPTAVDFRCQTVFNDHLAPHKMYMILWYHDCVLFESRAASAFLLRTTVLIGEQVINGTYTRAAICNMNLF
ncbi:MAG: hypothetical protein SGARI_004913, partial [Bacillariaceae sp.]